ncbi:aminobenzoyl-glutamate utilization protein A [Lysinibacillus parviboronicapiens]|uniref:Aminobenzoyl-glutamate utilization protein A n=1 Tax=Lysinibacillus parviboronicapiens TaxID=436516 RepID=A0ABV2PPH3_9BACI|nr:amidohydrolase [Lysinibacillus parviboronicapiens]
MTSIKIDKNYLNTVISWRRDFHQYPEVGWLEFRTASLIASYLDDWNYDVKAGKEVITSERLGVPEQQVLDASYDMAKREGAPIYWLEKMKGGFTGVVATLDTGKPGPTIAFRVDIDALPILESAANSHVPSQLGFRSKHEGAMHACGHDSHAAIGLGLAQQLMERKEMLKGKIKIIFQPAEEGARGGSVIAESSHLDDVDFFMALHIGTGIPKGTFVAGTDGFLASTKYDVKFHGVAAHSGAFPERGKNALLASAQATLALHSLPPHSDGVSRVNVGKLLAGTGRNIIPSYAEAQFEIRAETSEINAFYEQKVEQIIQGAATMYGVEATLEKVGYAINIPSNRELAGILAKAASKTSIQQVIDFNEFKAGSEDATFLMKKVQEQGGQACYSIIGTTLAAGHHHECFDIAEDDMLTAIEIWLNTVFQIYEEANET